MMMMMMMMTTGRAVSVEISVEILSTAEQAYENRILKDLQ